MFYIKIIILYYVVQPCLNILFFLVFIFLPENEAALLASREFELDKEYGLHFGLTCYYIINSKGNAILICQDNRYRIKQSFLKK